MTLRQAVDVGGRPVTDAGGRLVKRNDADQLVLDELGTEPLAPLSAEVNLADPLSTPP